MRYYLGPTWIRCGRSWNHRSFSGPFEYISWYNSPSVTPRCPKSRNEIYKQARTAKAKQYPHKDSRLLNASVCIPFIITSMGGLCKEGHEFLRVCKKKDLEKTQHMMDVLITQHAKWTARRVKRLFFGQWSLVAFLPIVDLARILIENGSQKTTQNQFSA